MSKLLVSGREAADMLSISERHLWNQKRDGKIPFVKMGDRVLYSVEALRDWIAEREQVAAAGASNGCS